MTTILQFNRVTQDKFGTLSFSLESGSSSLLQISNKDAKPLIIDLIMGEQLPDTGAVLLLGKSAEERLPGQAGLIQANGGMISNLKVWENITLPQWYHQMRQKSPVEQAITKWLKILLPNEQEWENFMASPVARLRNSERKLAGLLRMLVWSPNLLLLDAAIFDEVDEAKRDLWISAFEKYATEEANRAVLALTHVPCCLTWKKVE